MSVWLEVLEIAGPATVQDGGRPGQMHHGLPPGGALVPELLAASNLAVGNAWNAAALETYGRMALCFRGGPGRLAVDGQGRQAAEDERVEVPLPTKNVVRYVAVAGGLDVPVVLGGRGTLLVARLGGQEGRLLHAGDRLQVSPGASTRGSSFSTPVLATPAVTEVRVVLGPDRFEPRELAALEEGTFTVAPESNRMGMRLHGPRLSWTHEASDISRPMVRGAIQVPPSGEPIVLGPDHPTVGGYHVIAAVIRADWGRLASRRPGSPLRFRAVSLDEAREAWRQAPNHPTP